MEYKEPTHRVCEICHDDGECRNNRNHPEYDGDQAWGDSDYLDCCVYLRNHETAEEKVEREKRLEEIRSRPFIDEDEEPYESRFVKWARSNKRKNDQN